ncbi:urea carboxylase-associated family protein [Palleronia sp. LCG004]|uniref:urea carboxylase-associated family protein n=1 Tax=Palleronia sp. LCG004 TaxID=3079304 RepID=UPI002942D814|nr:urea carboxylase-associated family protein [Palleronia sp. LCG004]WOI57892.1 urea carboxylase-associated family protein [Palleronia sp. LCG004]
MTRTIVPARHGKALRLTRGQAVKLINIHGTQVVDCWAWNAADLEEHMSMEASRVWNQRLNPLVGDTFVTNRRNPILTIVEDTSPGVHDTFMAACDAHRYERLNVKEYHRNCLDNMYEALEELGLKAPHPILASFNIFMNIAVQPDGRELKTQPTVTSPDDHIILRAEMDCVVAFSACPQDIVPIQGRDQNIPKDAAYEILDSGFPDLPISITWVPNEGIDRA